METFDVSKARAVVFDLDGVICNTEPLHVRSWQILFARRGIHVPDAKIWTGVGVTDHEFLARLFRELYIKDEPYAWEIEKRNIYLSLLMQDVPEFPGAVRLVKQLSWNWPLAVASSTWREAVEVSLRRLSIRDRFQAVIAKEDVRVHKPCPDAYLQAADRLGVVAEDCAAIEDSIVGVAAAKRAGMLCIAVTNSFRAEQLTKADLIVSSLQETSRIFAFLAIGVVP